MEKNQNKAAPGKGPSRGGAAVFIVFFSIIAVGLLSAYWYTKESKANREYLRVTTVSAAWVAEQFGDTARVRARDDGWPSCHFVLGPGQATTLTVAPECGAIEVMAIFLAAVIAFPAAFWKKLAGIVLGIPALFLVNVFRVSCLFIMGAYENGKYLDFVHHYVWQTVYIVFVVIVWLAWVKYIVERKAS